jgi:hypothetical protein
MPDLAAMSKECAGIYRLRRAYRHRFAQCSAEVNVELLALGLVGVAKDIAIYLVDSCMIASYGYIFAAK